MSPYGEIITGLAAISGALVGGFVTYVSAESQFKRSNEREVRRERIQSIERFVDLIDSHLDSIRSAVSPYLAYHNVYDGMFDSIESGPKTDFMDAALHLVRQIDSARFFSKVEIYFPEQADLAHHATQLSAELTQIVETGTLDIAVAEKLKDKHKEYVKICLSVRNNLIFRGRELSRV